MEIFGTVTPKASISGLVVAIYEIGAFVGSIAVMIYGMFSSKETSQSPVIVAPIDSNTSNFFPGQYFGRRMTLAIGQGVIIIGAILQCTSYGLAQMIVGRIVTGFGMGHVTSTCTVWAVNKHLNRWRRTE
jgi:MFS family permease